MFKNLIEMWKTRDYLGKVQEDFIEMLDKTEIMFNVICSKLIRGEEQPGLKQKIYDLDKEVNELERSIRKRAVEHLIIQPSMDIPMSLLLMSVVKDAERLGDYGKNLYEVIELLEKPIDKDKYKSIFDDIDGKISKLFKKTKTTFMESDEDLAKRTWDYERDIVKRCDDIITQLTKSKLSVNESVCFALMARYFKRLAAHLTNISTSVILPISDLDYYDEKVN